MSVSGFYKKDGKTRPVTSKQKGVHTASSFAPRTKARKKSQVAGLALDRRMQAQWQGSDRPGLKEPGHAGDTDFSFDNTKKDPYNSYDLRYNSKSDMKSVDEPLERLTSFKGPTERKIYIGGVHRAALKENAKKVIDNNFTVNEVKAMGPLYLDSSGSRPGTAATCAHQISIKHKTHVTGEVRTPNIIRVNGKYLDDELTLTHELVHAQAYGERKPWQMRNGFSYDIDRMETKTDLAAIGRVSNEGFEASKGKAGYYWYVPEVIAARRERDFDKAKELVKKYQEEDRKLMVGNRKHGLKGKALEEALEKNFDKSHITRAHFSPAEKLDRYYTVKNKSGDEDIIHISYTDHLSTEHEADDNIRAMYPRYSIYEWKDGVKTPL